MIRFVLFNNVLRCLIKKQLSIATFALIYGFFILSPLLLSAAARDVLDCSTYSSSSRGSQRGERDVHENYLGELKMDAKMLSRIKLEFGHHNHDELEEHWKDFLNLHRGMGETVGLDASLNAAILSYFSWIYASMHYEPRIKSHLVRLLSKIRSIVDIVGNLVSELSDESALRLIRQFHFRKCELRDLMVELCEKYRSFVEEQAIFSGILSSRGDYQHIDHQVLIQAINMSTEKVENFLKERENRNSNCLTRGLACCGSKARKSMQRCLRWKRGHDVKIRKVLSAFMAITLIGTLVINYIESSSTSVSATSSVDIEHSNAGMNSTSVLRNTFSQACGGLGPIARVLLVLGVLSVGLHWTNENCFGFEPAKMIAPTFAALENIISRIDSLTDEVLTA